MPLNSPSFLNNIKLEMMVKNVFNTVTKGKKRERFCAFFNTNWLLVLLLMIGCFVGCKKDNEVVGKVGICPTVVSTNPINGAINVVTDKRISASFNEHLKVATINTSTFLLYHGANQVLGTVSFVDSTATFTPVDALLANTVYTATITSGVRDSANTALPVSYVWSFNTGKIPTVVFTNPINAASDVPFNKIITATFSTNMNPATINSSTYTLKQGSITVPGIITYAGMVATFTPTLPLLPKTVYTATITGVSADSLGNIMAVDYVWSFATGALPAVLATDPANGAINVVLDQDIAAIFNKLMNATTINTSNFIVKQGNTAVAGTVSYTGKTATFVPTSPLAVSTIYTATITTGVKDSSGNNIPVNYTWNFTTSNAPVVIYTDPASGATNVALKKVIIASFSTAMDPATINGTTVFLKQGTNIVAGTVSYVGTTAVFTPTAALIPNTLYTGTVTASVKDILGNMMGSNYTWNFTTTLVPPTVTSSDPANGTINIPLSKPIFATFSRAMNPASINQVTFVMSQGFSQVFGTVTYSGTTATFTPERPYQANTLYTATITTGAMDVSGNALASNYTWSFATGVIQSIQPPVLGNASIMGAFGGNAGVTNQGTNTVINNGSLATTAVATSITGFHDGTTGDVYTETPLNVGDCYEQTK